MLSRATPILCMLALAPALASAQDEPAEGEGTEEEVVEEEVEALPTAEIGPRLEETIRGLQDAAPHLRRQREVRAIERSMESFQAEIERLRGQPALRRLDSLSPGSLKDLEREWLRVRSRLDQWQAVLESRSSTLTEERQRVVRAKHTWQLTLDAERDDPLPEALTERIETAQELIARVESRLDRRLEEVLALEGALSDVGIRIAAVVARINSARHRAREQRERPDHEPLWTGGFALDNARPEPPVETVIQEHRAALRAFVTRDRVRIIAHGLIFLTLFVVFLALRIRLGNAAPSLAYHRPLRGVRARPLAAALLLTALVTPWVYTYVPAFVEGIALLTLVPTTLRLRPYLLPQMRVPQMIAVGLAPFAVVLRLGFAPGPIRRITVLALSLVGTALAIWLMKGPWRAAAARLSTSRRRLYWLFVIAGAPMAAAAYYVIVGLVERATLWSTGSLLVVTAASAVVFAVGIVGRAIAMGARTRAARILRSFEFHRRPTVRLMRTLLRAFASIALLYFALDNFDLLDALLENARLTSRKSYEFGSIELSLGDLVSFASVLIGTVVVVRAMHYLMQRELLPRLSLGQGTESAISLTVSYVLVAFGIVLAFATAGVEPEDLALLGGALGVGIGFGLQDVVRNFVAGLILVAERPINVGDVIEAGDLVGQVHRIGIRSSTIRSLEGAEVILPNADLISGQLVNWTLSDARRRVDLAVGIAYSADPTQAKQILERAIRRQPGVLMDPPPSVIVTGFGDNSVDLEVRVWIADFLDMPRLKSEVAQRVFVTLAEEGIEIPFPQRDIHVRSIDEAAVSPGLSLVSKEAKEAES